jgi:hypothetical protein
MRKLLATSGETLTAIGVSDAAASGSVRATSRRDAVENRRRGEGMVNTARVVTSSSPTENYNSVGFFVSVRKIAGEAVSAGG